MSKMMWFVELLVAPAGYICAADGQSVLMQLKVDVQTYHD
jgi:hypothetical protein